MPTMLPELVFVAATGLFVLLLNLNERLGR
jgi:hypothetical protein